MLPVLDYIGKLYIRRTLTWRGIFVEYRLTVEIYLCARSRVYLEKKESYFFPCCYHVVKISQKHSFYGVCSVATGFYGTPAPHD